jgi:hypothetical protein
LRIRPLEASERGFWKMAARKRRNEEGYLSRRDHPSREAATEPIDSENLIVGSRPARVKVKFVMMAKKGLERGKRRHGPSLEVRTGRRLTVEAPFMLLKHWSSAPVGWIGLA